MCTTVAPMLETAVFRVGPPHHSFSKSDSSAVRMFAVLCGEKGTAIFRNTCLRALVKSVASMPSLCKNFMHDRSRTLVGMALSGVVSQRSFEDDSHAPAGHTRPVFSGDFDGLSPRPTECGPSSTELAPKLVESGPLRPRPANSGRLRPKLAKSAKFGQHRLAFATASAKCGRSQHWSRSPQDRPKSTQVRRIRPTLRRLRAKFRRPSPSLTILLTPSRLGGHARGNSSGTCDSDAPHSEDTRGLEERPSLLCRRHAPPARARARAVCSPRPARGASFPRATAADQLQNEAYTAAAGVPRDSKQGVALSRKGSQIRQKDVATTMPLPKNRFGHRPRSQ